jgi:hypothetical protein
MITIPYRLVKLGDPITPVKVFVLRKEQEAIVFSDFEISVPIPETNNLQEVTEGHLPASMTAQIPSTSITILPVREATDYTVVGAMAQILDAMENAYCDQVQLEPGREIRATASPARTTDEVSVKSTA